MKMKRIFSLLTLALLSTTLWAKSDSVLTGKAAIQAWVADGDEHYRLGNYDLAASYYGLVLSTDYASADLYYNLGNCYYRTDQMGLAILYYKRALHLDPSMRDAKENLALAQSHTIDRIAVLPQFFLVRWIDALCTHISPTLWQVIWLILLALLGGALFCFLRGGNHTVRKVGFISTVILALLLALSTWLLIRTTHRYNAHSEAVVTLPAITVKSSPEKQSVDKLILHEGTLVNITDSLAGWYKITLADGTTGWCGTDEVERI